MDANTAVSCTSVASTRLGSYAGAIYTGASVERDGLIITANGPAASSQFGETIAIALEERRFNEAV